MNMKDKDTDAIFDDYTKQPPGEDFDTTHWTQVCDECAKKLFLLDAFLDIGAGRGTCGARGCSKESDHYYDFIGETVT